MDIEALWSVMDAANGYGWRWRSAGAEDDDDDNGDIGDIGDIGDAEDGENDDDDAVVVPLEGGTFHVCRGMRCPHAEQCVDREKHYVCSLSGRVIGAAVESAHDAGWTGRSCGSADPDMASGAVPSRTWRNKRDAFTESARAYSKAKQINDDDVVFSSYACSFATAKEEAAAAAGAAADGATSKRGAPCVSEIDEAAVSEQRRAKAMRRITSLSRRDVQARLIGDAMAVVQKLFSAPPTPSAPSASNASAAPSSSSDAATSSSSDPRLENFNFVFTVGLKRYVEKCVAGNDAVDLSSIHDVAIAASNFVRERRNEAKQRKVASKLRSICVNTRTVEICARLIVSVWNAVCVTSHFLETQTGDSFRPFAAGVVYGLKRGIRMKSGLTVVPRIDVLADQLPTLRSSASNAEARQLQASSHRGLCSLHRALASIDGMSSEERAPVMEKLRVAAQIAAGLEHFVAKCAE